MTDRAEAVRLLPSVGVLVVWAVLMPLAGGFEPQYWLPAGLVLLGLLAVAMVGGGRLLPAGRPARLALGAFAAFTAWNFLSIAWSDAPGSSLEASDLLLVTLLGAWTLALAPWRARTAWVLLLGFSAVAAAVCASSLVSALGADNLTGRFLDFRWMKPLDYPNTTAAFAFMAAVPALVLAARPDVGVWARAGGQGLATFLGAFALLPQSRGSVLGGAAALLVLLAVVPFRWRFTTHALAFGVTLALASGPVFDVYTAAESSGRVSAALDHAARAIALATAAGVLLGLVLGVIEDRWSPRLSRGQLARRAGVLAVVAAVLGVGGLAAAHAEGISDALSDQWRSLKHPGVEFKGAKEGPATTSRLTDADPLERYDYWRVALDGFRAAPLIGMGAAGFEHRYTTERRYPKVSKFPHNIVMKAVGENGLIGVALLLATLAGVLWGLVWRLGPAIGVAERGVIASALGVAAYFVAHGQFDWLEAYPVLTGPAVGLLFVALAVREHADRLAAVPAPGFAAAAQAPHVDRPELLARIGAETVARDRERDRRHHLPAPGRWTTIAGALAAAVAGLLAVLAVAGPWLSVRYTERARADWRADPATANADLDRAADLNPLDPSPLVLAGVIGIERGDLERARTTLQEALDREQTWLPHFGLALLAAADGDQAGARSELARTRAISPLEPTLPEARERILGRRRIDPGRLLREVLVSPLFQEQQLR